MFLLRMIGLRINYSGSLKSQIVVYDGVIRRRCRFSDKMGDKLSFLVEIPWKGIPERVIVPYAKGVNKS